MFLNYGSYQVEQIDHISIKVDKFQDLALKIYFCPEAVACPIIIFSHGVGSSEDSYSYLGRFWSSHGYVCIFPSHIDSEPEKTGKNKKRNFLRLMGRVLKDHQLWLKRAKEISLIIDSLDSLAKKDIRLKDKLNSQNIGVGGHSFGAYTAQLVGGVSIDIAEISKPINLLDQRINSLLLISPQGRGQQGLNETSWNSMTLPMMVITGTNDNNAMGKGFEWRKEPFDFAPPGEKYFVLLEEAHHFSFGGTYVERTLPNAKSQRSPEKDSFDTTICNNVQAISLAFWNSYLKKDEHSQAYLANLAEEKIKQNGLSLLAK